MSPAPKPPTTHAKAQHPKPKFANALKAIEVRGKAPRCNAKLNVPLNARGHWKKDKGYEACSDFAIEAALGIEMESGAAGGGEGGAWGGGAVGGVLEGDAVADDLGEEGVALGVDLAGTFPARGAVLFGLFVAFDGCCDGCCDGGDGGDGFGVAAGVVVAGGGVVVVVPSKARMPSPHPDNTTTISRLSLDAALTSHCQNGSLHYSAFDSHHP